MSSLNTQIWVPEYHSPAKETKAAWKNGDSRAGEGKVQDDSEQRVEPEKRKCSPPTKKKPICRGSQRPKLEQYEQKK